MIFRNAVFVKSDLSTLWHGRTVTVAWRVDQDVVFEDDFCRLSLWGVDSICKVTPYSG